MNTMPERIADKLLILTILLAEALVRRGSRLGRCVYFDTGQFAWNRELEAGWRDIRAELDAVLLGRDAIPAFQEVSEEQRAITDDDRWKTFVMFVFGTPIARNCERCPRTVDLLRRIPGLKNAMFSILAPGKAIPGHRGPYNGLLRYQLALKVPCDSASCAIWVHGERREWREGEALVFDDSYVHSVRNDTDEERVVLFADFERPLAWPLAPLNRALLAWIARRPFARRPIDRLNRGLA